MDSQIKSGAVKDLTVYYLDLFDGPWFSINEAATYNSTQQVELRS